MITTDLRAPGRSSRPSDGVASTSAATGVVTGGTWSGVGAAGSAVSRLGSTAATVEVAVATAARAGMGLLLVRAGRRARAAPR